MTGTLLPLFQRREVLIAGLVLAVVLLLWVARRVRQVARSDRPDEALSNVVMLIGLAWSSEAVWEITRHRLGFPLGLTLLLFFVFETLLVLAMIRAKRHMREFGWPGRFGTTAWTVAGCMALVAVAASRSLAEAALRAAIPLLVTKQWWDGLVGGAAKRPADASTWRWTPRRLLLAMGAIEPGERDVTTVHRERLTQQMTTLYHRMTHGSPRWADRRAARLARLSLTADDDIIAEVRRRGDRALWFTNAGSVPAPDPATPTPGSGADAGSTSTPAPARGTGRQVRPRPAAAAKVAKVAARMPAATPAQIAAKAGVSERTARRYLPTQGPAPTSPPPAQTPTSEPPAAEALPVAA